MERLTLNTFTASGVDFETGQYNVLGGLKFYNNEFSHNRLYPALAELIDLASNLEHLVSGQANFEKRLHGKIKEIDITNKKIVFESAALNTPELESAFRLIEWSLPHIHATIREGAGVYEFVDENLRVEEVGILPMYRNEGYVFVPDNKNLMLHIMRYEMSLYSAGRDQYRTLKTHTAQSVPQGIIVKTPEALKQELMAEFAEMPNPATFVCETDLDFPFKETIWPVAKRKLLAAIGL
ncbi:MAG: hypothetical protein V4642_10180 [Bacteroidota bacterium]